jgi:hypothetical protein
MAQTGLSAEEIRALLEKSYDDYDNMNFTFVGRKREG